MATKTRSHEGAVRLHFVKQPHSHQHKFTLSYTPPSASSLSPSAPASPPSPTTLYTVFHEHHPLSGTKINVWQGEDGVMVGTLGRGRVWMERSGNEVGVDEVVFKYGEEHMASHFRNLEDGRIYRFKASFSGALDLITISTPPTTLATLTSHALLSASPLNLPLPHLAQVGHKDLGHIEVHPKGLEEGPEKVFDAESGEGTGLLEAALVAYLVWKSQE